MVDVVGELLTHRAVNVYPAGHLPYPLVVGLPGRLGQLDIINGRALGCLVSQSAGELGAIAHGAAFVVELPGRNVPALIDLTHNGIVGDVEVIEELLTEFRRAV